MYEEEMMQEALERIKLLKLHSNVANDLRVGMLNKTSYSILYWIEDEETLNKIREFETENDCMVYHVIESFTDIGTMLSLLYVPRNPELWEKDRADLACGEPFAYVINLDAPECSEFGYIGIRPAYGGVVRTA